jgi:hypothetical protein
MKLDIEFADGRVGAVADGTGRRADSPASAPAKPRKLGGGGGSGQGSLFG